MAIKHTNMMTTGMTVKRLPNVNGRNTRANAERGIPTRR
jgi:hypothetical protein